MTQDPLSISATILPESTYDPVQFAREEREKIQTEQKEQRERYNEAWSKVGTPSGLNRNLYLDFIKRKSDLLEEGANLMTEGIDVTDITNPKYAMDAMGFRQKLEELTMDVTKTKSYDQLLSNVRQAVAKDAQSGRNIIDQEATNKNISFIQNAKNTKEVDDFLASMGDDLIVFKKKSLDIPAYINENLANYGVSGIKKEETKIQGGKEVTRGYNELDPTQLRNAIVSMYNSSPDFRNKVKEERSQDVTDLRGVSDIEWVMERYGNPQLRKMTSEKIRPYEPKTTGPKGEKQPFEVADYTTKIRMGDKEVPLRNVATLDQSKSFGISLTDAIDPVSLKRIPRQDNVDFTPRRIVDVKVLKENMKIKGKTFAAGTVVMNPDNTRPELMETKRFVEGVYKDTAIKRFADGETKQVSIEKVVLKPYDEIKEDMNLNYKTEGSIPELVEEVKRKDPATGKVYIFDARTKKFLREE